MAPAGQTTCSVNKQPSFWTKGAFGQQPSLLGRLCVAWPFPPFSAWGGYSLTEVRFALIAPPALLSACLSFLPPGCQPV